MLQEELADRSKVPDPAIESSLDTLAEGRVAGSKQAKTIDYQLQRGLIGNRHD